MRLTLSFLSLLFLSSVYSQPYSTGPVLGVISLPSEIANYPVDQYSYFPSSYVKFIESGGAQVIPIQYDLPEEDMVYLLDRVNAVVFTGGDSKLLYPNGTLTPVSKSLEFIVNYVIQQNMDGNYYPLWGVCQGFEVISRILARNFSILTKCAGCAGVNKNNFIEHAYKSKLFADLSDSMEEKMNTANLSFFNQEQKLPIDAFKENAFLSSIVTPVSYTYDADGVKYVSSYESPYLPLYALQFHQEKAPFEWNTDVAANHGWDAISLQEYLANYLVNEARKNRNSFPDRQQYLIDNYNVTIQTVKFTAVYLFPKPTNAKTNIETDIEI